MTITVVVGVVASVLAVLFVFAGVEAAVRGDHGAPAARVRRATPGWVRRRLEDGDVSDVDAAWRVGSRSMILPCALGWLAGGVSGLLVALVIVGVTILLGSVLIADRRTRRIDRELPPAIESVARALRGGVSVHEALGRCGDDGTAVGHDLRRLVEAPTISVGLETWVEEQPVRPVELTAAALAVGTVTGTGLARALDQFSLGLRVRSDTRAEARALSSQARASAGLLTLAPFAFLAVMAVTDPRIVRFLFGSSAGWACLGVALVLDAGAAAVMISMTRVDR